MYRFDDNATQSMQQEIESQVSKVDAELENFESAKNGLKQYWEGDESEQYEAIFSRFQQGATATRNVQADVHNALSEAGEANNQMRAKMRQAMGN